MRLFVDGRRKGVRSGRFRRTWLRTVWTACVAGLTAAAVQAAPVAGAPAGAMPGSAARALDDPAAGNVERSVRTAHASGWVPSLDEREALEAGQAAIGREVPDIELLDRRGRRLRLSAYRGRPLLVSFIYTGCFQVCPAQTRALDEAMRGLAAMVGPGQFNVVSIGFNQPFDSPDAMRAFAAQHRIDWPNWEFLSPPREAVPMLTRAFGFSYVATPAGFDHVLGVTVVDASGRIHAQVYGDRLRADQLGVPLRELLLSRAPQPDATVLRSTIERIRLLCTVYDPDTGQYRTNYKLLLSFIGGSLFFVTAFTYLLLAWRDQRRERARPCVSPVSGKVA